MKNIHIIPTDKPSRLGRFIDTNNLVLKTFYELSQSSLNIYITSDSKFVRDEYITDGIEVIKATPKLVSAQGLVDRRDWKKIIITTDQDLIKDGVQTIPDEFLEWFVKNPSCDTINIDSIPNSNWGFDLEEPMNLGYKIIIPKEEFTIIKGGDDIVFPSSTTITVFKPLPDANWGSDVINEVWDEEENNAEKINQLLVLALKLPNEDLKVLSDSIVSRLPQEETKQIKCYCGHTITCDCEPLQETLKEFINQSNTPEGLDQFSYDKGLEDGAKWEQERMYSEEQLKEAFLQGQESIGRDEIEGFQKTQPFEEWFEQFKKK